MEKKNLKIKKEKPELLAPVGNFVNLKIAIDAGADAVYLGLKEFSLRSGNKNFELKDLYEVRERCQKSKIKLYLTINSIVYNEELEKIERIIKEISENNLVDAIICWDLGVIRLCKKYKVPFHVSTQGSVSNSESVKFYKSLGAERIVFARELSLEQIEKIVKETGIDAEIFIHGAMCVAVSGRCFTSQFLFGKSANRGQCIHPCRRSYIVKDKQEGYELEVENDKIFSAKDLCALPFLERLVDSKIKSFKIEGRNRDPRYIDRVVRVYRRAIDLLDSKRKLSDKENKELFEDLKKVYNKGFSSGFYFGVPTSDDFSNVEHSQANEKKRYVGKIKHYYQKKEVAEILLSSKLKKGDKIAIIGKSTGLIEFNLRSMEIEKKKIDEAVKGQEVAIKIPSIARKNDEVYVVEKNN